jgi:hypothetical protein
MRHLINFNSLIIIFLFSIIITSCGQVSDHMLITDEKFTVRNNCDARGVMELFTKDGKMYWKDQKKMVYIYDENGDLSLWCNGMIHIFIGKVNYGFYTFISSKDDPLQFLVDRNVGYHYISGKGKVVTPEGKVIILFKPENQVVIPEQNKIKQF